MELSIRERIFIQRNSGSDDAPWQIGIPIQFRLSEKVLAHLIDNIKLVTVKDLTTGRSIKPERSGSVLVGHYPTNATHNNETPAVQIIERRPICVYPVEGAKVNELVFVFSIHEKLQDGHKYSFWFTFAVDNSAPMKHDLKFQFCDNNTISYVSIERIDSVFGRYATGVVLAALLASIIWIVIYSGDNLIFKDTSLHIVLITSLSTLYSTILVKFLKSIKTVFVESDGYGALRQYPELYFSKVSSRVLQDKMTIPVLSLVVAVLMSYSIIFYSRHIPPAAASDVAVYREDEMLPSDVSKFLILNAGEYSLRVDGLPVAVLDFKMGSGVWGELLSSDSGVNEWWGGVPEKVFV